MVFSRDAHQALEKLQQADDRLDARAKNAWCWRILYLRGLINAQLQPTQGFWGGQICTPAFEELTVIYHAQGAEYKCAPPTAESVAQARISEFRVKN